ncbi:MAG: hypothetical protein JSS11_02690 [Verrucomicrobia bacterium]|nr:hypothetical protein [Verrucomicrobiota bacterium]
MKRSLTLSVAVLLAAFSTSGCHFFSKKEKKPKENPAIATDTEVAFKLRWVDRRVAELTATGLSADAARTQAEAEFREHYSYTHAANK